MKKIEKKEKKGEIDAKAAAVVGGKKPAQRIKVRLRRKRSERNRKKEVRDGRGAARLCGDGAH